MHREKNVNPGAKYAPGLVVWHNCLWGEDMPTKQLWNVHHEEHLVYYSARQWEAVLWSLIPVCTGPYQHMVASLVVVSWKDWPTKELGSIVTTNAWFCTKGGNAHSIMFNGCSLSLGLWLAQSGYVSITVCWWSIVHLRWVDQWKNANNLAVLHAIVTGPALIDCVWKCACYS